MAEQQTRAEKWAQDAAIRKHLASIKETPFIVVAHAIRDQTTHETRGA